MKYHQLGKTDMKLSELSFGTWALGGDWGDVTEEQVKHALNVAIDKGVNFFDTADVYGGGRSERIIGEVLKTRNEEVFIATKFGRRDDFADLNNYRYDKVRAYCEDSLRNLQREAIDLYQIHCPSSEVLHDLGVFEVLERLKEEGKIRYYGVSVETDDQAEFVMQNTNASSLQIIFNMLRQKPLKNTLPMAQEKNIGILARVPLASGVLSGKYTKDSVFPANDHRNYNADGKAFNVGETFGGIPFAQVVEFAQGLAWTAEGRGSLANAALKWILQQQGVTTVIPGFKNEMQVNQNLNSLLVPDFSQKELETISEFYWKSVHDAIRGPY